MAFLDETGVRRLWKNFTEKISDIRQAVSGLQDHTVDDTIHVTEEEKAAWNESDVFIAIYDETTSAEIEAAFRAGKVCLCKKGMTFAPLIAGMIPNAMYKFAISSENQLTVYLCGRDTWSTSTSKFTPSKHASTHASGGSDPITPDSIGAAPAYSYGTEDLEAGVSELETGKLHFVYE